MLKNIVAHTYKPLLVKYLSSTRTYRYKDIRMEIPPQVFHPGFFFSTQLLLKYISKLPLRGQNFLEPGCGSGLISIVPAKKGARVTATDINTSAVSALEYNSNRNKVSLQIITSDLFQDIPKQPFDIIAVNPPYYKRQPLAEKDYAWFCGEHGEYFSSFFSGLGGYIHAGTAIIMVLFENCDMEMINGYAYQNGFKMTCIHTKRNVLEKNFIFQIEKIK